MSEVCGDNRFKLIGEFKGKLVEGTNIETSPEEMAVLDNILFRIWQMGWLDKLKAQEPRVMSVQEVKQLKHGVLVAYEARGLRLGDDGKHHMTIVCHAAEFETIDSRGVIWFHGGIGIEGFKNYGRVFRVWTSLPTEEQRKEAKWSA